MYGEHGAPSAPPPPAYEKVTPSPLAMDKGPSPAMDAMQAKIMEVSRMMSDDPAWRGKVEARALCAALGRCIDMASAEHNERRQQILNAKVIWRELDEMTPPGCDPEKLASGVQRQIMGLLSPGCEGGACGWGRCASCCSDAAGPRAGCNTCACSDCCQATAVTDCTLPPQTAVFRLVRPSACISCE